MLPKPKFGTTCNRCGFCCISERCGIAVQILGEGPGPCPALEWDGTRSACGILRNPDDHIPGFALARLFNGPQAVAEVQSSLAFTLAIGSGCDSDDDLATEWNRSTDSIGAPTQ
jgi:hypothetical protein